MLDLTRQLVRVRRRGLTSVICAFAVVASGVLAIDLRSDAGTRAVDMLPPPDSIPGPTETTGTPVTTIVPPSTVDTAPPPTTAEPATSAKPSTTEPTAPPAGQTPPAGSGTDGRSITPSNTGFAPTGVSLAAYTGPQTITKDGTVIEGKDISEPLDIQASNVVIKRSRIRASGDWGIIHRSGSGLLVEDVEITSAGTGENQLVDWGMALWSGGSATARRVYIHHTRRGINLSSNVTVESSYIGDNVNKSDTHTQAILSSGGGHSVVLRNNYLSQSPNTNATAAVSLFPEEWAGGPNDDFLLEGNLLDSGGGFGIYLGYTPDAGESPNTNFRLVNNWFGVRFNANCGTNGPVSNTNSGLQAGGGTWTSNRWYAPGTSKDGTAVNL